MNNDDLEDLQQRLRQLSREAIDRLRATAEQATARSAWAKGGVGAWRGEPFANERGAYPVAGKVHDGDPPSLESIEIYSMDVGGRIRRAQLYYGDGVARSEFLRVPAEHGFDTVWLQDDWPGGVREVGIERYDAAHRLVEVVTAFDDHEDSRRRRGWSRERYEHDEAGRLTSIHGRYDSEEFSDSERPPPPYVYDLIYDSRDEVAAITRRRDDGGTELVWRRPRMGRDVDRAQDALASRLGEAVVELVRTLAERPTRVALVYLAGDERLPPDVWATSEPDPDWNPAEWDEPPLELPEALAADLAEHSQLLDLLELDGHARQLLNAAARTAGERLADGESDDNLVVYAVDHYVEDLEENLAAIGVPYTG